MVSSFAYRAWAGAWCWYLRLGPWVRALTGWPHLRTHLPLTYPPTPFLTPSPFLAVSCLPSLPAVCRRGTDNVLCRAGKIWAPLCVGCGSGTRIASEVTPWGARKAFQSPFCPRAHRAPGPLRGQGVLPDAGTALYFSSLRTKGDCYNRKTDSRKVF